VRREPEAALRIFTENIGDWWPLVTHGVFDGRASVAFEDGELVERSESGERSTWAEVTEWDPPRRLSLAWHPGHPAQRATRVDVAFDADDEGTRVVLTHSGWEQLGDDVERIRSNYDNGWVLVLDRYVEALAGR
jgi:uncharacterized protein YndB with AHSA1/START domain